VHAVDNVLPAVVVQAGQGGTEARALTRGKTSHVQWAAALGSKIKLLPAGRNAPADVRFGLTLVPRPVNVVDVRIHDRVEDAFGLARRERPTNAGDHATQLQGTEAEGGHAQAGASECAPGEGAPV